MITELWNSFVENVKERVKNPFSERNTTPFAGAFLIAVIIYNWKLVYSLFNFDPNDTRTDKIEYVSKYLQEVSWEERLLYPLLIAFCSIIFYYIFNHISLGLTTFFNRWFKATVLAITDRGKIATREELQQKVSKMNRLNSMYEALRETFADSRNEIETQKAQIISLTSQYETKNSQLIEAKNDLDIASQELDMRNKDVLDLKSRHESFKVIDAKYGKEGKYIDVTSKVNDLFAKDNAVVASNDEMGEDPIRYAVKELSIVYQSPNGLVPLVASENEVIKREEDILVVKETDDSKRKKLVIENRNKLSAIFTGAWKLTYSIAGKSQEEVVFIDASGKYYANYKHTFNLTRISVEDKTVVFNKIALDGSLHATDNLTLFDDKKLIGVDSKGFILTYDRIA